MTRFHYKKLILTAVVGALLTTAGNSFAQPGGGWGGSGGGMRGGMNSDSSFDRLLQSYGGSGDTLDYAKVPADTRQRMDTFAKMVGGQPTPSSGSLSRAQYKIEFDTRMQTMQSRMGRGPGGPAAPAPAATANNGSPQVVMVTSGGETKPMTMAGGPNGQGGGFNGQGQGGGRGGFGGGEDADTRFAQYDTNADGKLTKEELQANPRGGRILGAFDQSDTNRDGSIDLPEYRTYYAAAMGGGGGGNWGGGGQGGNPWNNMQDPNKQPLVELEDEKPVIVRYGKLPTGLPEWFTAGDTNRDAQISLFEYCRFFGGSTEQIAEFKNYDLNGDSLLTAEEYLRHIKSKNSNGAPNLNGYAAPILANPVVAGPPQRGGPVNGLNGPTPSGTTPAAGDNRSSRDQQDKSGDKAKEREKEKDAAKVESKDQRGNQSGSGKDRGSRPGGKEPSK